MPAAGPAICSGRPGEFVLQQQRPSFRGVLLTVPVRICAARVAVVPAVPAVPVPRRMRSHRFPCSATVIPITPSYAGRVTSSSVSTSYPSP